MNNREAIEWCEERTRVYGEMTRLLKVLLPLLAKKMNENLLV